jgi:flagellar basal-body rod modification protein FlgD
MTPIISAANIASQTSTDSTNNTVPLPTQMLSEQDFLNLLVTQMTAQDPLKPMDSQDMLAQMVQFSTLNANTTMQTQLQQMGTQQVFSEASSLLGKQVTLQLDSSTTQGVVTGVDVSTGAPQIVVNGQSYDLNQVLTVTNAPTTP